MGEPGGRLLCGCCGEPAHDLRPHTDPPSGWGACFACGMADARYMVGRGCTRCQGKPPVDAAVVMAHNLRRLRRTK